MTSYYRAIILMVLLLSCSPRLVADTTKVALFLPHISTPFWQQVVQVMAGAGRDFGMELEVHYGKENHRLYVEGIRQRLARSDKPDFLVFKPYKKTTREILSLSEQARVPAISFNTLPFESERPSLGSPREIYKYWLAELAPDDQLGGYHLAKYLIQTAKEQGARGDQGDISIIGINGPVADVPARLRYEGLVQAVKEDPAVRLLQVVHVDWRRSEAQRVVTKLLRRHEQVSVIWTAADAFAMGVVDSTSAGESNVSRGSPIIGGFDWMPEVQAQIKEGRLTASIGGHFLEGAWVMVLIHDYLNGSDFQDAGVRYLYPMGVLGRDNLDLYSNLLRDGAESLDFTRFSRVENPALQGYDFGIQRVLEQLSE